MTASEKAALWESEKNSKVFYKNGHITSSSLRGTSHFRMGNDGGRISPATRCCLHILKGINVRRRQCVVFLVLITVFTIIYYSRQINYPFVR